MRHRLLGAILGRVALPALSALLLAAGPSSARADDDDGLAQQRTRVEDARHVVESLYVRASDEHAALVAFAGSLDPDGTREAGAWPAAVSGEQARSAIVRFVERAALGEPVDGLVDDGLPAAARWRLWLPGLAAQVRERASASETALARPADLFVEAVAALAALPIADAWDRHMQEHPTLHAWRDANQRLADLRRVAAARAPTRLIPFERGRFEVGPWEGWLQDISEKDNRRQKVSVAAVHVQEHEVTCAQYADFLAAQPAAERPALTPAGWEGTSAPAGREDHPVTGVSYLQAAAYAAWLGMRLPTEDEWERVAAGGDATRLYPWGAEATGRTFACRDAEGSGTFPVGLHPDDATPEGVRGLAGNVKELVATHPDRKPVKRTPDAADLVVIRGGGYRTRPDECSTRWRWFVEAGTPEPDVGFRCVVDSADLARREHR